MKRTRVLLVTDNRLFREGTLALMNARAEFEAVAVSAVDLLAGQGLPPDIEIALVDYRPNNQDKVNFVGVIRANIPHAKIIIMNLDPKRADIPALIKTGVVGFICDGAGLDELADTVSAVARGEKVLPPPLMERLFLLSDKRPTRTVALDRLSVRERQVVECVADGLSNRGIAGQLQLSIHTVKSHVHNILQKLALQTRLELAHYIHTSRERRPLRNAPGRGKDELDPKD